SLKSIELTLYFAVTLGVALVVREYARAWMANRLGDLTPKLNGRLTLDIRRHAEPFGTILLPILLLLPVLFGRNFIFPVFAYAKPLPLNPWTLRRRDRDLVLISVAGPIANTLLAFVFGAAFRAVSTGQVGSF